MRLRMTPPQIFSLVSLLLVIATVVATSLTHWGFFRDAVINREAVIVRDMVHALALQELSASDLEHYGEATAKVHFEQAFAVLKNLSGVVRIKLFDSYRMIVWSDEPKLIGKRFTVHEKDLGMAITGQARAVINPAERKSHADEGLPVEELIEFYVPITLAKPGTAGDTVHAAVSVYRSARELNDTVRSGLLLLWLVTGIGGAMLFALLYGLFQSVYRRQREAESKFAKLSTEHARIVQMEKLSAMGRIVVEIPTSSTIPWSA